MFINNFFKKQIYKTKLLEIENTKYKKRKKQG